MKSMNSSISNETSAVTGNLVLRFHWIMRDRFLQATWWQQILTIAISAIVYIFFAGWLGATWLPLVRGWGTGVPRLRDFAPADLPALFVRWDSGYYYQIATNGYRNVGTERAFFPLYPLVVRAISTSLGVPLLWSGLLVSVLSFLSIGLMIYKWVHTDYEHEQAVWATVLLCTFPMAFYFLAFYAEPLFMVLSVLSLYLARHGRFAASGIAIALAGATRPQAFLLGVPYVLEFWQQRNYTRAKWLQFVIGILIASTGPLAYVIFLAQLGGGNLSEPYLNLLQAEWKTHLALPWVTLTDGLNAAIFSTNIQQDWFSRAYTIHDTLYAILGLTLSLWAFRHLRLSVASYLFVGIMFFYAVHGPYGYAFESLPRHVASLAPVYLALAVLLTRLPLRLRWISFGVLVLQLGILSAWFASGRWVS